MIGIATRPTTSTTIDREQIAVGQITDSRPRMCGHLDEVLSVELVESRSGDDIHVQASIGCDCGLSVTVTLPEGGVLTYTGTLAVL